MKASRIVLILLCLFNGHKAFSQEEEILVTPEISATYPNGEMEMFKFIAKNFKYPLPENVIITKIHFAIRIDTFGVAKFDTLYSEIESQYKQKMEQELTRIVMLMPKWEPGKLYEQKIETKYIIPFRIELK